MAIPCRLNVVTLAARDVAGLRRFYEALGWPVSKESGGPFAAFHTGGALLCLFQADHLEAESGVGPGFGGVTLAVNLDQRDDVDAARDEWVAAGGRARGEAEDREWGGRSAYVEDPEGNVWELVWNPHTSFDERGGLIFP